MKQCKCGCGQMAKHAYAPGHRPVVRCSRCNREFSPLKVQSDMCSQCRFDIRTGRPAVRDSSLVGLRAKREAAPEGRHWCMGCERYRALKFFGTVSGRPMPRCKPCNRKWHHASMLSRTYNISPERYAAIKEAQGGRCAICQVATGATKELAVDHDHSCCPAGGSCGECVRGALCSKCNNMLGFARDDPAFFERAAEYLRNPPARGVL